MATERSTIVAVRLTEMENDQLRDLAFEYGGISRQDVVRLAVKRLAESSAK